MCNFDVKDAVLLGFFAVFGPTSAMAQSQVFAYPSVGQSEEQQSRDRFECHQWSVSQTGFDPTTAPPLPARMATAPPAPNQGYTKVTAIGVSAGTVDSSVSVMAECLRVAG